MPNATIVHDPSGKFDLDALKKEARDWPGLVGMDLVPMVTSGATLHLDETPWEWDKGYGRQEQQAQGEARSTWSRSTTASSATSCANSWQGLQGDRGGRPTTSADGYRRASAHDGVFLSNGPGRSGSDRRNMRCP